VNESLGKPENFRIRNFLQKNPPDLACGNKKMPIL
jgi:hypothetical protein